MAELAGAARSTQLPCVRLGFALWYLPADQALPLLRLALEAAELVLVAEFKLAERNLELPATLAARGLMALTKPRRATGANKTDGAALTDFMQKGGIEGLVHQCKAVCTSAAPYLPGLRPCCICNIPRVTARAIAGGFCVDRALWSAPSPRLVLKPH